LEKYPSSFGNVDPSAIVGKFATEQTIGGGGGGAGGLGIAGDGGDGGG